MVIRLRVSLIMLPHSGTGGLAPSPRKLSAASSIIMVPMSSMEVTSTGPMIFGRRCFRIILNVPLPESFTARIHVVSFRARVWLRAIRAYLGQEMAAQGNDRVMQSAAKAACHRQREHQARKGKKDI